MSKAGAPDGGDTARLEAARERLRRAWRFANEDIWDIEISSLTFGRGLGVRILRVVHMVIKGFQEDECPLHASALTFNSLMAIVPLLALSLSLARVFGGADLAKQKIKGAVTEWTQRFGPQVIEEFYEQPGAAPPPAAVEPGAASAEASRVMTPQELAEEIRNLVDEGFEKVEQISFGTLSGVGLVLLLWMVIAVLGRVEASFNRVWGVASQRPLWRKFTDYLSVVVVVPFLGLAATSLPIADFATSFLNEPTADMVRAFLGSGLLKRLTAVVMTSFSFTFLIMFMPNTKVRFLAGLAGGFVSGLFFIAWILICASIQVGVAKYGKIYGSFAIVPILLAWVFVSWEIVFLGAEVAFGVQNCGTYRMETGARSASVRSRVMLALSILAEAARALEEGGRGFDASQFATRNRVPVRLLNDMIDNLEHAGLLGALSEQDGRYALLKAPERIAVRDVIGTVLQAGVSAAALGLDQINAKVVTALEQADGGVDERLGEMTVRDLVAA